MKKKIGLGIIATMLVAGAFVFANNASQQDSSICYPGCVCPKATTELVAQQTSTDNTDVCDSDPNCICK